MQRTAAVARGLGQRVRGQRRACERHARPRRLAPAADGDAPVDGPERGRSSGRTARASIYDTFDRIFSCKGHGWANLQSMQINLPFRGDEEFARLHAAIRVSVADPAGPRRELADRRRRAQRASSTTGSSSTAATARGSRRSTGRGRARADRLDRRVPRARARADLPRSGAARSRGRAAPRVGQRARRDRALRPRWRSRSACSTCRRRP